MLTVKRITQIDSCTACGQANYPAEHGHVELYSITAGKSWTTVYCSSCLYELRQITRPTALAELHEQEG